MCVVDLDYIAGADSSSHACNHASTQLQMAACAQFNTGASKLDEQSMCMQSHTVEKILLIVMEQQLGDDRGLLTSNAACKQSHGISHDTHVMLTRSRRSAGIQNSSQVVTGHDLGGVLAERRLLV